VFVVHILCGLFATRQPGQINVCVYRTCCL